MVTTASKQRPTIKQASLISPIGNIILPSDSLSMFVVVLYVDTKITLIDMIGKKESEIRLIRSGSLMRYTHTSLTKTERRKNNNYNIPHATVNNLNISHLR